MNRKLHLGAGLMSLAFLLGLGGCSGQTPPKEPEKCKLQTISAAIITSPHINPSETGEPRPVQVRLYQIKNDTSFLNATFEDVWKDDKKALGDDLVSGQEFPVYPNARTEVTFDRNEAAQYMIAAALFREPKGRTWYVSFELPPPPSAGACAAKCKKGQCDPAELNTPKFYAWIDGSTIVEGSDHADDYPEGRVLNAGDEKPAASNHCSTPPNDSRLADAPTLAPEPSML